MAVCRSTRSLQLVSRPLAAALTMASMALTAYAEAPARPEVPRSAETPASAEGAARVPIPANTATARVATPASAASARAQTSANTAESAREPTPAPTAVRSAPPRAGLSQGRFAHLEPFEHAGKTYYPYSFDGHVHTHHSPDAYNPPPEVLEEAERGGLSALVITDHGSPRAKLDFRGYKGRVLPFVGQEIGGPFGHAVFWNVDLKQEVVPSATSLAERAAFAHAHGGMIVLCHPGWWIQGREEDPMKWITPEALKKGGISGDIDALELWNGMYDKPLRRLITAWEAALEAGAYVPIVGNSDFHRIGAHRLGGPRNLVYCEQPDPEHCLWDTVKAGRLVVTDGPSLMMTVNGSPLGASVAVGAGSPLSVKVTGSAPQGGELRLYLGRTVVESQKLAPHAQAVEDWKLIAPTQSSYVRVEIVKPSTTGGDDQVLLLSNAIHVHVK